MELHQLRYFTKVAQLGNYTRAAEELGLTQPSLSQQIIKLEHELGQPVFERLGRKVALTDAGRLLLERAAQILALVDDAKQRITDDGESGQVVLAAIPTIAPYLLPGLLRSFTKRHPRARFEVHEETTDVLLRRCQAGELDLAILALPVEGQYLHAEPLFEEELLLVMPPDHPLLEKKRIVAADLASEPFVLLGEAHCLSEDIAGFCRRKSFQPVTTGRTSQLSTVQELVALGHGVSLIPAMARAVDASPRRVYRSLSGDRPTRTVAMVWHEYRYQSRLVKQFIEAVRGYRPDARK